MKLSAEKFDVLSGFSEEMEEHPEIFAAPLPPDQIDFRLRDLAMPPTLVTAAGMGLVFDGCRNIDTIKGVNKIVTGRVGGDLLDGMLARKLNMTSDAGAFADTAADKIGMLAIAGAAWHKDAIPKPVLSTVIARHTASVGLTAAMAIRHPETSFRPSQAGKYAMAADNVAFLMHLYGNAIERERPDLVKLHQGARKVADIAYDAGNILSVPTLTQYATRTFRP